MIPDKLKDEVENFLHDLGRHLHANSETKNMTSELVGSAQQLKSALEKMDKVDARTQYFRSVFHLAETGYVFKLSKDYNNE